MLKEKRVIMHINVNDVVPDTAQPRQDWDAHKKELNILLEDMKKNGMYYPIIVAPFYINSDNEVVIGSQALEHKNRKWWILDGERRWRCSKLLGLDKIESIVRTELNMLEMMEIQFASNTKRLQVTIREMSKAVERYRDEYKKEHEDYVESKFIKSLCKLTGYSSVYFNMVEAINRADDDMKEDVLSEKIGGYAPFEIEKAVKDKDLQRGLTDAYIESDKQISALAPRAIKFDLRDAKTDHLKAKEKRELAKQMLNDFVNRGNKKRDIETNYLLYEQKANKFRNEIRTWNLDNLEAWQCSKLIGIMEDIRTYFLEDRRLNNQTITKKEYLNIKGKETHNA
mgnify:CR=1 FL=1